MIPFHAAEAVHAALPWDRLAHALERAFARGANVPLRHAHRLGDDDSLLLMPAWRDPVADDAGALGVKVVTVMPSAARRGAATVAALYVLLDRATGAPRALIDGEALTVRRTAAASAVAARYMARADADTLLVIGSGTLAPFMAQAHCALRPTLKRVHLWGRTDQRVQSVAQRLRDDGLPVEVVDDLEAAMREAHIVCCATTATAPPVRGAWLAPGTHLDLVGGFRRAMREADDAAVARARIAVDSYTGALSEAGDIVGPLESGIITRAQIVAELAELVTGQVAGRTDVAQITLFKSVGTALADLAAAELVAEHAAAPGAR
ncbi:MAG: ornithine cyclodeaminase family protein [Burkholderiaceae bacterium]|nr:ornithine cyclodeaminase family protein [Burkholderiaceae bacterium]